VHTPLFDLCPMIRFPLPDVEHGGNVAAPINAYTRWRGIVAPNSENENAFLPPPRLVADLDQKFRRRLHLVLREPFRELVEASLQVDRYRRASLESTERGLSSFDDRLLLRMLLVKPSLWRRGGYAREYLARVRLMEREIPRNLVEHRSTARVIPPKPASPRIEVVQDTEDPVENVYGIEEVMSPKAGSPSPPNKRKAATGDADNDRPPKSRRSSDSIPEDHSVAETQQGHDSSRAAVTTDVHARDPSPSDSRRSSNSTNSTELVPITPEDSFGAFAHNINLHVVKADETTVEVDPEGLSSSSDVESENLVSFDQTNGGPPPGIRDAARAPTPEARHSEEAENLLEPLHTPLYDIPWIPHSTANLGRKAHMLINDIWWNAWEQLRECRCKICERART